MLKDKSIKRMIKSQIKCRKKAMENQNKKKIEKYFIEKLGL